MTEPCFWCEKITLRFKMDEGWDEYGTTLAWNVQGPEFSPQHHKNKHKG